MDTQASGEVVENEVGDSGPANVSRGYHRRDRALGVVHPGESRNNSDPDIQAPLPSPSVALGDAVIALTTNIAAEARPPRIDFKEVVVRPQQRRSRPRALRRMFRIAST